MDPPELVGMGLRDRPLFFAVNGPASGLGSLRPTGIDWRASAVPDVRSRYQSFARSLARTSAHISERREDGKQRDSPNVLSLFSVAFRRTLESPLRGTVRVIQRS